MALFDDLMGKLGGLDVPALAARAGLNEDQVRTAAAAITMHLANGKTADGAAQAASADTGLDPATLQQLIPLIQEHLGGAGGMLGQLSGMFGQPESSQAGSDGLAGEVSSFARGIFGRD